MDKRIEAIDIDDGRKVVLLRPGYAFEDAGSDNACHTFGADTTAEIRAEMKRVEPCNCPDCRKALAGSGRLWS